MQAGSLRHRVTFQDRPADKDSSGQRSGAYADVADLVAVPAKVTDLSGRELVSAQSIDADISVKIELRGFANWRSRIRTDMRAIQDGRIFDIKSATNPDGKNRALYLLAIEILG